MRNTISKKYVQGYILDNYGSVRHDISSMVKALNLTASEYELNKKDLFHYIIEGANTIPMATSYGFDTRYGRELRRSFEAAYYSN